MRTGSFNAAQQDLKACFVNLAFATKYEGDGKDPDDMFDWTATADQPGYRLALEMSNGLSALAAALSQNDPNAPRIAIDLDITRHGRTRSRSLRQHADHASRHARWQSCRTRAPSATAHHLVGGAPGSCLTRPQS